jgi:ABC-2 type transport system ATP-binding protein
MIEVENLTKRYGDKVAVDALSFQVRAGTVTGFLGPNGAGKSTTMRMIAGLDRPSSGRVLVNGRDYRGSRAPMAELGVLLEAGAVHPGRSARNHLLALGATAGIGRKRVAEVIDMVGLGDVAGKRVGSFSLGMGQRLGIAAALLGQPGTIVLDEPVNGLDPDGVRWVRVLLRSIAEQGGTVLVSSHLLTEMAQTADRVVVIGQGRLIAEGPTAEFVAATTSAEVRVRTPDPARLRDLLTADGVSIRRDGADVLHVAGLGTEEIGTAAWRAGLPVFELSAAHGSLEDAFMTATRTSLDYTATIDREPVVAGKENAR